jgi:hypothetical protein
LAFEVSYRINHHFAWLLLEASKANDHGLLLKTIMISCQFPLTLLMVDYDHTFEDNPNAFQERIKIKQPLHHNQQESHIYHFALLLLTLI